MNVIKDFQFIWLFKNELNYSKRSLGLAYQLYRSKNNRWGIIGTFFSSRQQIKIEDDKKIDYPQYRLLVKSGCFVHPRVAVFIGYNYNYWNESNKKLATKDSNKLKEIRSKKVSKIFFILIISFYYLLSFYLI